ncbi:MAG: hypothetical protein ABN478_02825 [Mixta sp.]|uniref:hypothetical protein n=1 Tax=Mixta sp. Marseille-Q2659 TaxID=2736607 RepID=UPI0023B9501B|nr:hypothetical protein [Mixta sp. Marseille-Q2659]
MKKRLAVMLLIAGCGTAQAATDASNEAQTYIAGLCALTADQPATGQSQEALVQKLKQMSARGASPYAMDKPEFNQDEAEKVAKAYNSLPDEVKQKNRDAEACKKVTLEQYQKAE